MSLWEIPGAHESADEYGSRVVPPSPPPTPPKEPKDTKDLKPPRVARKSIDPGEVLFALRGLRALAQYKTWRDKSMFREVIAAAIKVLEEVK